VKIMTTTTGTYGEIIEVDEIAKASRGAQATYDEGLLDFMSSALADEGKAAHLTGMVVQRSAYKSDDEYRNAKQTIGAELRKHFRRLVEDGRLPKGSKLSINWHPETGAPQISLKGS